MSENLNYSRNNTLGYCYGTRETLGTAGADLPGCDSPYGRNYTYVIAMDGNSPRGLCPSGWHIPTRAEWQSIGVGTTSEATGSRNMSSGFYVYAGNYNTNSKYTLGWGNNGTDGYWWTSDGKSYFIFVSNARINTQSTATDEEYFSVRCVQDGWSPSSSSVARSSSSAASSSSAKPSSSSAAPSCEYDYNPSWCGGLSIDKISKPTTNNTISENGCFFIADAYNVSPGGNAFSINGQAANPACWSFEDCTNGIEPADGGYYFYKTSGGKWQIEGVSKNSPSCPSEVIVESCGEMNAAPVVGDLALSVSAGSCMRKECSGGYLRLATYSGSLTLKLTGGCSNASYQPKSNLDDKNICSGSPGIVYIEVTSGTSTSFEVRCY